MKETTSDLIISFMPEDLKSKAYTITPRTVIVIELIARLVSVNTVTH